MNDGTHIDRTKGKTIRTDDKGNVSDIAMRDMKSVPLFAHEPSVNDIRQVALGDCYLQASLATLAENEPETIKRMFRDNGDGTVVVRFYSVTENEKKENKENKENNANPSPEKKDDSKYKFSSLYVTVKK